jgi:hypothetical protein
MAHGPLSSLLMFIMCSRPVPMAVPSVDIKVFQFFKVGQRIGELAFDFRAKKGVEFNAQAQTTGTLERFEKKAYRRRLLEMGSELLKKPSAGGRFVERTENTHLKPMGIRNPNTVPPQATGVQDAKKGFKKLVVSFGVGYSNSAHANFGLHGLLEQALSR